MSGRSNSLAAPDYVREQVARLHDDIFYIRYTYWTTGSAVITHPQYKAAIEFLEDVEEEFPDVAVPDSPTKLQGWPDKDYKRKFPFGLVERR